MLENAHRAAHFFWPTPPLSFFSSSDHFFLTHSAALFSPVNFFGPLRCSLFSSSAHFFWPTLLHSNQITTHLIMHSANINPLFLVYPILNLHNNSQISILTTKFFLYTIRYFEFFLSSFNTSTKKFAFDVDTVLTLISKAFNQLTYN